MYLYIVNCSRKELRTIAKLLEFFSIFETFIKGSVYEMFSIQMEYPSPELPILFTRNLTLLPDIFSILVSLSIYRHT